MAPVLRLVLLLAAHLSPLGVNPLLHIQAPSLAVEFSGQAVTHELPPGLTFLLLSHTSQTPSALQWEQPATWHSKHLVLALLGLLVCVVQVKHLIVFDSLVHVWQSATPPFATSLQRVQTFLLPVVVVGK